MKRIYLVLVFLASFTANSFAQSADMEVIHNVTAGSTIIANNANPNSYVFSWRFINHGPTALTTTDTIKLKAAFRQVTNPYRLNMLAIGGLPVGDTAFYTDTVAIVSNGATQSSNNTNYNWCDSIWVVNQAGQTIADLIPNNNRDCDIVTFAIWVTNINEADAKVQALHVYPNPATTVVNFKYNFGNNAKADVVIRNVVGKTVYSKNLGNVTGEQQFSLDVSSLSAGIYMVELNANGKKAVERITIQ